MSEVVINQRNDSFDSRPQANNTFAIDKFYD